MADWTVAVPTRSVDGDGNAVVVGQFTDENDVVGTVTVTLSPGRVLTVLAEGIDLADFRAWST